VPRNSFVTTTEPRWSSLYARRVQPVSTSYPANERRFLPAVPDGFGIGHREPLANGLRRVSIEQLDLALAALADAPVEVAVHEVRKSTKRLRAVLRLVRTGLGNKRYSAENAILRDTARLLAPMRDAYVRLEAVEMLRERYDAQLRPSTFQGAIDVLTVRKDRLYDHASDEWSKTLYALRSARARYAAWPVDEESARAHGMAVIPHAFASVEEGLARTYARGREEMDDARRRPTADNFHRWRKRAKYLRHQMEILTPVWPDVLGGHAVSLERLGDLLGSEHDLAELLRFLAGHPEICPDPVERSMLVALVQHRRVELQTASLSLGSRIYAEPVGRFTQRVRDYWVSWDAPVPVGFSE
jgi:CHAD domain-containing protein